jgi:hypothetical protein
MKETSYQSKLIKKIETVLPEAVVLKNDPRFIQGIPDLIVLWRNKWAALELKKDSKASIQPNQQHYVDKLGAMSFASFINPETEGEVLDALQTAFGIRRKTRVP